ncbi:MAG: hypothetical protein AB7G37_01360 [Solirubrobacteraceae bacterium]
MTATVLPAATSAAEELRRVLDAALHDADVASRLRVVDTTARIRIGDGPVVAVALDEDPPRIVDAKVSTTIELSVTVRDWEAFLSRRLPLAVAVAETHRGPVRRLLQVMPIVRSLIEQTRSGSPR